MRNPRDFSKPLAIGAPDPLLEIPVTPSRMIHFFDLSNEKIVGKLPDIAHQGRHPARQPRGRGPGRRQGGGASRARAGGPRARPRRDRAVDAGQLAREPVGARRHHDARGRDRRPPLGDHGPEGRGAVGHPLRRPAAGPARGARRAGAPDPRPRDPRDLARRGQPRGDRPGLAAHAGHELRAGRPRRLAADEDDPRRRRPPRLPRALRPRPVRSGRAAPERPAGPLALLDRAHGRRLHRDRDPPLLRAVRRHPRPRRLRGAVPRRLPDGLRRRVVAAPGARSRSRRRSSPPTPTRSSSPAR